MTRTVILGLTFKKIVISSLKGLKTTRDKLEALTGTKEIIYVT